MTADPLTPRDAMIRLLVCGDRDWTVRGPIRALLQQYDPATTVLIHGAARGADTIAAETALELGMQIDRPPLPGRPLGGYPANWNLYERAAGPIRNTEMLVEGKPDEVHAFHNDLRRSRGTRDMVHKARRAGIPVTIHTSADRATPKEQP